MIAWRDQRDRETGCYQLDEGGGSGSYGIMGWPVCKKGHFIGNSLDHVGGQRLLGDRTDLCRYCGRQKCWYWTAALGLPSPYITSFMASKPDAAQGKYLVSKICFNGWHPWGRRSSTWSYWTFTRQIMPWKGTGVSVSYSDMGWYRRPSQYFKDTGTNWIWWPTQEATIVTLFKGYEGVIERDPLLHMILMW